MDWNDMRKRWHAEPATTPMATMLAGIGSIEPRKKVKKG